MLLASETMLPEKPGEDDEVGTEITMGARLWTGVEVDAKLLTYTLIRSYGKSSDRSVQQCGGHHSQAVSSRNSGTSE